MNVWQGSDDSNDEGRGKDTEGAMRGSVRCEMEVIAAASGGLEAVVGLLAFSLDGPPFRPCQRPFPGGERGG